MGVDRRVCGRAAEIGEIASQLQHPAAHLGRAVGGEERDLEPVVVGHAGEREPRTLAHQAIRVVVGDREAVPVLVVRIVDVETSERGRSRQGGLVVGIRRERVAAEIERARGRVVARSYNFV